MKIQDTRILTGPNYWSVNHKMILMVLDIGEFEDQPTDKIPGFYERIYRAFPGLYEHTCSPGYKGGFLDRIKCGTWMGHVIEHIAIELQIMAGIPVAYGKTRGYGEHGVYRVAYEFLEENAGIHAGKAAVDIALEISNCIIPDVEAEVEYIKKLYHDERPGPSTRSIINAALARDIPYIRLDKNSLVQLGYGKAQKRIEATLTEQSSFMAVETASDKARTLNILKQACIPVPYAVIINSAAELPKALKKVGYPAVIKPNDSNQGKGVTVNIFDLNEARTAYKKASQFSRSIIIEQFIQGKDYRLLVINYKLIAASERTPASITGDGKSTIKELIQVVNKHPDRGNYHENLLTKIKPDSTTEDWLKQQGLTYHSVLRKEETVYLRPTANLSTGGTAVDVTDVVHPEVRHMAERVARIIGLDICGIDYISENIGYSPYNGRSAVLEVNAAPGFRMHAYPSSGLPRPVGEAVVRMLFPGHMKGRIPVIAITGTNGKTTTTSIIAYMARMAGFYTGHCTTNGIYFDAHLVEEGDCTGPISARKILTDKSVEFAVLECARGGVLRSGLAFDQCDVGIVTNVVEDHIGLKGIHSLEEMTKVKSVIPESVKRNGLAILNACNTPTMSMTKNLRCRIGLVSINGLSETMKEHINNGGLAAYADNDKLFMVQGEKILTSIHIHEIPVTYNGTALFNTENCLFAMMAAFDQKIPEHIILNSLKTYSSDYKSNPGRMNLFKLHNHAFLLDYAHNFHAVSALGIFIKKYKADYRIGIISAPGDRRDVDIYNIGKASAEIFDKIIIRLDDDTRGRAESEIIDLLTNGVAESGKNIPIKVIPEEHQAIRYALTTAIPNSLIVLLSDKVKRSLQYIIKLKEDIVNKNLMNHNIIKSPEININHLIKRKVIGDIDQQDMLT